MRQPFPLILASASPYRQQILEKLNLSFEVIPSYADEFIKTHLSSEEVVKILALRKAEKVAKKINRGVIIGVDTIVVAEGQIYGKPKNLREAKKFLQKFSGKEQEIYTGLASVKKPNGRKKTVAVKTKVKMRKLSGQEINRLARKHIDKAGAYGTAGRKDPYIEKIVGDYENIIGLPVKELKRLLQSFGF